MTPINEDALDEARAIIARHYGDLSDLPQDVRNTIANIYYQFCCMGFAKPPESEARRLQSDAALEAASASAGGYLAGRQKYYEDSAHFTSAVDNMPEIIAGLRTMSSDKNAYNLTVDVFLMIFKYRLRKTDEASLEHFRDERRSYEAKANEIQNLWKLL